MYVGGKDFFEGREKIKFPAFSVLFPYQSTYRKRRTKNPFTIRKIVRYKKQGLLTGMKVFSV